MANQDKRTVRTGDDERDTNPPSRLLTVKEAAQRLGCSATNVYGLIDAGEIPYVCVGNAKGYRIDPRDLNAFIERRKQFKQSHDKNSIPPRPRLKHIKL